MTVIGASKISLEDVERLVQQVVGDGQRREEAQHVAVGAAGQHDDALVVRRAGDRLRERRVRLVVPASTSSTATMAPRPRTSPMRGSSAWSARQALRASVVLDLARPVDQAVGLDGLDGSERGGAGERVAAVGAAEAADVRRRP